jgi:hypothetical protein
MEQNAREKEERYAEEIKAIDRKKDLTTRIQSIVEEEKKVCDLKVLFLFYWLLCPNA